MPSLSRSVERLWNPDCIPTLNSQLSSGPLANFLSLFQGLRWVISLCHAPLLICSSLHLLVRGTWHDYLANEFQTGSVVQTFLHLDVQAYSIKPPSNGSNLQERVVGIQTSTLASIVLLFPILCRKSYLRCVQWGNNHYEEFSSCLTI